MLAHRIVPCLDVLNGSVVKGVRFRNHRIIGDVITLARRYVMEGADELVFYDIGASANGTALSIQQIEVMAADITIPFCVAGGIDSVDKAKAILNAGADKISINSPALANPNLIDQLASEFGRQCVVVGIDSKYVDGKAVVCQYTGNVAKTIETRRAPLLWAKEAEDRGAGEIVLNCMHYDGVRSGYAVDQLLEMKEAIRIPLIASGGAGTMTHFYALFSQTGVAGALAASVFHDRIIEISVLKQYLHDNGIRVRLSH
ncbi:MAG: imidazole glycerol phosphate synthase subunit HisF [Francisellaceae bacterium]